MLPPSLLDSLWNILANRHMLVKIRVAKGVTLPCRVYSDQPADSSPVAHNETVESLKVTLFSVIARLAKPVEAT
jgi:hypothetical protein